MKDRRRGSVAAFPFSMGCMSQSAVSVADPGETCKNKPPQSEQPPSSSSSSVTAAAQQQAAAATGSEGGVVVGDSSSSEAAKDASPGPGLVATGVSRLMKGIRSLSQLFAAYDDADGEEDEDEERELVIGYPTDVQHVGHIGWDGGHHTKLGATAMGMVNAFSLPSTLSLRQLEMAMDQHHHAAAVQASA